MTAAKKTVRKPKAEAKPVETANTTIETAREYAHRAAEAVLERATSLHAGAEKATASIESGAIVGCGAIASDPLSWSPHVGELRVLIGQAARGHGVGRKLTQRLFARALEAGLEKIVAQMTVDQTAAIAVFEGLGFRAEALLRGHVRDHDGKRHDIVILGHEVADVLARLEAFGVVAATSR